MRLGVAEHVERERHRALGGHQPGHLVPAGHHDQGTRRAGQQRPHLGDVARVVQDDQHPLAVEQAAEQGGPALGVGRDPVRRHAQRVEEEPQRLGRLHRRRGRIQAAQVDVQLAAREPLGDLTAEPDGERGLPRPRRARDDHDRHRLIRADPADPASLADWPRRGGRTRRLRGQHRLQHAEFFAAAGETRRVERQLGRHRRDPALGPGAPLPAVGRGSGSRLVTVQRHHRRAVRDGQGGIHGQHLLVDAGQVAARIDAQLVGEHPPALGEHPQRLGVPPAAVQRDHQQPAHPLAQRMVRHHGGQVGHDLLVPAERQQHVGALFGGRGAQLAEPDPLGLRERPGHPGERDAPPQRERGVERGHRADQVPGLAQLAGPAQVLLEGDRVRLTRHQVKHVAGAGRDQDPARTAQRPVRFDDPAQAGHVGVDAALGAGRGILSPDGIDELTAGDHPVRPHR